MPDNIRISSRTFSERFCASSMMSSTLRPAAYCSMRKLLRVAISSAFFILKGEKPNWARTDCRNSTAFTWVWLICAMTTSESSWRRKLSMRVVLPDPISPVTTTKPSVNQMVDSMYALARAWARDRYRNCGSGLSRKGSSRSLKLSICIAAADITVKRRFGQGTPQLGSPNCEPGRAIDPGKYLERPPVAGFCRSFANSDMA